MATHRTSQNQPLALEFTKEQKAELKEAFQLFDKDGDGTMSTKELVVVRRSIGLHPSIDEI